MTLIILGTITLATAVANMVFWQSQSNTLAALVCVVAGTVCVVIGLKDPKS